MQKKQVKIPIVLEGGRHSIMLKYCIQQCSVLSLTKRYRLIKGHRMNGPPTFDGVIIEGARCSNNDNYFHNFQQFMNSNVHASLKAM